MSFINRDTELGLLKEWWERPGGSMALLWGRRRVGKTALLHQFAKGRRAAFHTARGASRADELHQLGEQVRAVVGHAAGQLDLLPYRGWHEALQILADVAGTEPLLVIFDEFSELATAHPHIESDFRAAWEQIKDRSLKILLCGSAVRTMRAIAEYRSPLYGRFDLNLHVRPFRPHEAALMLADVDPENRARVWGLLGGVPQYLSWWDQAGSLDENLRNLACKPAATLITEGELVLATEGAAGGLARQVLTTIAGGRTRYTEIAQAVQSQRHVASILADLESLQLVERVIPVTEDPRFRSGRTSYRIADNFLAFWLGILSKYLGDIDRGRGSSVLRAIRQELDGFMGPRYEEAFRTHLIRLTNEGRLDPDIIAVGPFWTRGRESVEIDAVALAGMRDRAVLAGECKWAASVDGPTIRRALAEKVKALPNVSPDIQYAVCARSEVRRPEGLLAITARDIFS